MHGQQNIKFLKFISFFGMSRKRIDKLSPRRIILRF